MQEKKRTDVNKIYDISGKRLASPQKGINIISVAVDTTQNDINTIAGRIGRLDGVSAKTVYSAN